MDKFQAVPNKKFSFLELARWCKEMRPISKAYYDHLVKMLVDNDTDILVKNGQFFSPGLAGSYDSPGCEYRLWQLNIPTTILKPGDCTHGKAQEACERMAIG